MHVSAFYASSVQLGTHPHMWLHCVYTRELALTKRTLYNTTQPTHVDMRRASQGHIEHLQNCIKKCYKIKESILITVSESSERTIYKNRK